MTLLDLTSGDFREGSIPVLETERLFLRAPRLEDASHVAALANDKRIAENTCRLPYPYTRGDAEDFIASPRSGGIAFLITRHDDTVIGACGIAVYDTPYVRAPEEAAPEIGYWLGVPYWGRGYATEAVRALIDFAFTELDHDLLQAGARVTNPASRRILEKCGFQWTRVGLRRIRALATSAPIDRFRLDRSLWTSLRSWREARRVA
jgi:RimJ/RimL family protein N-acetyltransferase